jgi:hypothetical protein
MVVKITYVQPCKKCDCSSTELFSLGLNFWWFSQVYMLHAGTRKCEGGDLRRCKVQNMMRSCWSKLKKFHSQRKI